jgi:hypothetical protein
MQHAGYDTAMARTITISFPHELGEEEAKRRIVAGIADARSKYPEAMKSATETWVGNELSFRAIALGKTVSGRIDVQPKTVTISVDLPFVLGLLAGKIRPRIEAEGRKMLER